MDKIRLGDEVVVIAGKDKGKSGKVLKVFKKKSRILVDGVNLVKKSMKSSQENPNGGHASIPTPLHISNIQLQCPHTKKATRVRIQASEKGNERFSVKAGKRL